MVWNDMQWYSYSLPFLLMQWHARICFAFTYIAIPADANLLNGYALNGYVLVGYVLNGYVLVGHVLVGYVCHSCWCRPFEWIRIEWIRIAWIRIGGIRIERIRIGGIRIGRIRFEWICVGYVWCDGYVWDMCGVRYANNLLKNPATKRLSGIKNIWNHHPVCYVKVAFPSTLRKFLSFPHRLCLEGSWNFGARLLRGSSQLLSRKQLWLVSPLTGATFPFQMAVSWLLDWGDPNYLRPSWDDPPSR